MSESLSLKELSARVPSGAWSVFDMRGVVEIQGAGQKPIVHWSGFDQAGHAPRHRSRIAAFIVALVNAYRAGRLHTSEDLASAEAAAYAKGHAKGRAEGISEFLDALENGRLNSLIPKHST